MAEDAEGTSTKVIITPTTRISPDADLQPGDTVVIFGDEERGEIRAYGIRQVSGE
jgi:hypothetical protein